MSDIAAKYPEVIRIEGKKALYASYMAFLKNGGLFLPHRVDKNLGDSVNFGLTYVDDDGTEETIQFVGKVIWKTPHGAQGGRAPGIGIQFGKLEGKENNYMQLKMESFLGEKLKTDDATYTM